MSHKPETLAHAIQRLGRVRAQRDSLLTVVASLTDGSHLPDCEYHDTPGHLPEPRYIPCSCQYNKEVAAERVAQEIRQTIQHEPKDPK